MAIAETGERAEASVSSLIDTAFGDDPRLRGFAATLFGGVPARDVEALGAEQLREITNSASAMISAQFDGIGRVDVVSGITGGPRPRSLVRILNRDMPFLVDSAMNALQDLGIEAELLLHPVFRAERRDDGNLESLAPATRDGDTNGRAVAESLIVILIENLAPEQAAKLQSDIAAALTDVRYAVADWRPMLNRLDQVVTRLETHHGSATPEQVREAVAFSRWLLGGQFVFLGMREYALNGDVETGDLNVVDGSNLGVLRDPDVQVLRRGLERVEMTPEIRRFYFAPQPIFVTKSNVISRVHRSVHMDYVGLKIFAEDGRQTGELRVVGLFTSKVYTTPPGEIPLLRVKADRVISDSGYVPGSHDAKALANVIDTFPRDELFQIPLPMLTEWVPQIVELESRPRGRLFFRPDRFDRFVSALVFIPRERFSTAVREKIGEILSGAFGGQIVMFQPFFTEGRLVRVHFIVSRFEGEIPDVDAEALEDRIAEAGRSWRDRLANAIAEHAPDRISQSQRYCAAFPANYTETHSVSRALIDAERIDALDETRATDIRLEPLAGASDVSTTSAVIYSRGRSIPLSERVPVFEQMGFRVLDEQTFNVALGSAPVTIHDMRLRPAADGNALALPADRARALEACFLAVQQGAAESDRFNSLILTANCAWREAAVLRAYALYARQTTSPYGPNYIAETLNRYPNVAALLVRLFAARFDPDNGHDPDSRAEEEAGLRVDIETALSEVPSLDEDRILRTFVTLMTATLRTNFYQRAADRAASNTIAFKLNPRAIDLLPEPRPYREIWVYSPEVEGVHLRFAPIARGGLRWSDRAQDFRTEVLGLCKAQQVKNTVIVPEGAKGGFFPKKLPKSGSRDEVRDAAVAAYQSFIGTMLDITDNIVDGQVIPRDRVVRHDGDDPYLVVAADKGTATFSDYANAISEAKGHWLGDAFASGGSAGYDHKQMGITARGAWECVKRNFREMDHDIQTQPFTAAGVGDMSGDVFGNGMLLSPVTRVVAAFDHRDIFIDPNPDPESSFAERQRLFDMGRSSWKDYDTSKISTGGGVFSRAAKSIEISDEIRAALDITDKALTPNQLMTAILKAPVDLMWFGGIGTYIRATNENDADVGDRGNDAIRVTAPEVRAKVIGEGANLGVTQPGRVEFAAAGGRLNTDFIDNSAGVNSSDIEVNIKIGLGAAIAAGKLDIPARNELLVSMTDEVAQKCLWNNRQQSLAISLATRDSEVRLGYLSRLMRVLERRDLLDRALEDLPDEDTLGERQAMGRGLERPEVSVLLSYAKIAISSDLMESTLAEDQAFEPLLFEYFPTAMQETYRDEILNHRLRKEIIVTRITNSIVNRAGPSAVVRLSDETGRSVGEIARAIMATRAVFGLPEIWTSIDDLDNKIPGTIQLGLYSETQDLLLDQAGASLRTGGPATLNEQIAADKPAVEALRGSLKDVATGGQLALAQHRAVAMVESGVPDAVAQSVAKLELLRLAPSIGGLASDTGAEFSLAAKAMFDVAGRFDLLGLRARVRDSGYSDYYDRLASTSAMSTIEKAAVRAAKSVIANDGAAETKIETAAARLREVINARVMSVSRLTVSASQIRDLMET